MANLSSMPWPLLMQSRRRLLWVGLALLVLILDQASKFIVQVVLEPYESIQVSSVFSWVLVYNTGAAFSFLSNAGGWQRWLFISLSLVVTLYLLWELWRLQPTETNWAMIYALILGGAWGNLWDRIVQGKVTDFILFHYQQHAFPAFNVADCAISLGVMGWLWMAFVAPQSEADDASSH